ncbi:MAG: hypothetical protein QF755_05180 [Candidatus Peribacteraceae bacterium]|jgi:hypothetical protein|nr:hypothetical protein [Candidatus Peribacteraceae bacterium]HCI04055.1 hypothetical protein [Candidatus Peribacteria bacterium]|tara:strand:- start:3884 stop:6295 length:2412 start_codon:yes stop_codon:yes gene_type:complete
MRWLRKYRIHFVLFLGSLALRLIYVWQVFDDKQFRKVLPRSIDSIAMDFLNGVEHVYPTSWASFYIPLAYFYKALNWLGALDERFFYVAIVNCFLGAAAVVIFYALAKIIFPGRSRAPIILAIVFSLYYPGLYFNALILSENLFTPLFLGSVYLIWRYDGRSIFNPVITGLLLGVCTAIRPILFSFLPLFALWMLFKSREKLKLVALRYLPILLCGFILAAVLISIENNKIHKHKRYAIAENGGVNVAMTWCQPRKIRYHASNGDKWWFSPPVFWNKDRSTDIITDVPFHNQMYYYKMGFNCMLENPERIITNFSNLINIFHGRMYPNLIYSEWHYRAINFWKIMSVALLIGFLLYPVLFRRGRYYWTFGLLLILSLLSTAYFANPGEERYLVPYYFVLILWGLPTLHESIARTLKYFSIKRNITTAPDIIIMLAIAVYLLSPKSPTSVVQKTKKPLVNEAAVERSYNDAAYWLVNNQRKDGSFVYRRNTNNYKTDDQDNSVKQILASHGLANAASHFNDAQIVTAHRKNLKYVSKLIKKEKNFSCIQKYSDGARINETTFAIMAFMDSPFSNKYKKKTKQLGKFLLHMQKDDGSFHIMHPPEGNKDLDLAMKDRMERFASGQAILACVYMYRFNEDPRYLECARKAYEYYFPKIKENFRPSWGSWHTIAYTHLYEVDQQEKYREAIRFMADELMSLQNTDSNENKIEGGFDMEQTWYTSAEAVFTEALGYAAGVHKEDMSEIAEKYEAANRLGIQNLRYFQFGIADTRGVAGGIMTESWENYIYVDNVGHSLMAFDEFLSRE